MIVALLLAIYEAYVALYIFVYGLAVVLLTPFILARVSIFSDVEWTEAMLVSGCNYTLLYKQKLHPDICLHVTMRFQNAAIFTTMIHPK